jgi:putative SOS response-associated peptidase YedK
MCGRFAQPRSSDELARIFRARRVTELDGDRFNVAPTDEVAAVVEHHGERQLDTFKWGLVPYYAESSREAARLINARAETVESSGAFRTAFRRRRCIIPADAFYEWRRSAPEASGQPGRSPRPQPFAIRRVDGQPMAFAGLWGVWRDPMTAGRLFTCSIVTTTANGLLAPLHSRMPVVLDEGDWDTWLEDGASPGVLRGMLHPAPESMLHLYPVGLAVNSVRNNGPELLDPLLDPQDEPAGMLAT